LDLDRVILERRSRRKYTDAPVSDEDIHALVEAARSAPSWANTQCVRYIIVRDEARRSALAGALSDRNPARSAVESAPVTVAFIAATDRSGYKEGEPVDDKAWYMFDTGLAVQNFCLKAQAMGLGTVICGFFDEARAAEALAVPPTHRVVAFTPLGLPEGAASTPRRLDLTELIHRETWQG
jgi:nitroreductase